MRTGRKTDNKGLTLIELIVTVAIIAIFSGVVLTFITTGSNTFRSTSSNAKVQMETQETFDQIEELIIDVNRSLYYANGSGESIGAEIKNDIKQSGGADSTGNKTFIVCNEYKNSDSNTSQYICDVLDWDKEEETIYYSQREYTADSSDSSDTDVASFAVEDETMAVDVGDDSDGEKNVRNSRTKIERSVLATGILDFRADVSKVESDKIVRFQLSTQNGTKQIETLHSVSLRNKVKVKKPGDAFSTAEPTNVGIGIVNAPKSMNPGEAFMLRYGLNGNGSIDPTTIEWTVVDNSQNGNFSSADPTNGMLTLGDDAAGSITVKVSARTNAGKIITSAPVTIPITAKATATPTPEPAKPKEMQVNKSINLVGAGNTYNIKDLIGDVTILYDDGTTKVVTDSVTWSMGRCDFVTLGTDGTIDVGERAGIGTACAIPLEATDPETGLTKTAYINIARIDLDKPVKAAYKSGDDREFSYVYEEGGAYPQLNNADISITVTDTTDTSKTMDYRAAQKFSDADAGEWTMNISYDLSKRGGLGIIRSSGSFTVENNTVTPTEGEIVLGNDAKFDTVIAGEEYQCSMNHSYGLNFKPVKAGNYTLTWSLKGKTSGISLENSGNEDKKVVVSVDALSGFVLCVDYVNRDDGTTGHAEREFKIASKVKVRLFDGNNEVQSNGEVVVKDNYQLRAVVEVYDANGNVSEVPVEADKASTTVKANGVLLNKSDDNRGWAYSPIKQEDVSITLELRQYDGTFWSDANNFITKNAGFNATFNAKAVLPTYHAEIVGPDRIGNGESAELYLVLKDQRGNPVETTVQWSGNNGNYSGKVEPWETKSGENYKVVFTPYNPSLNVTYRVTASYCIIEGNWDTRVTVAKDITVGKKAAATG